MVKKFLLKMVTTDASERSTGRPNQGECLAQRCAQRCKIEKKPMGLPFLVQIWAGYALKSRISDGDEGGGFVITHGISSAAVDDLLRENDEFSAVVVEDDFGGWRPVRLGVLA